MLNETEIEEFWAWFRTVANDLIRLWQGEAVEGLDQSVTGRVESFIDGACWEIGPGKEGKAAFVLSPDGDRERLRLTKVAIKCAPHLDGWQFYYAKPPKEWDFRFEIRDGTGQPIKVDASEWRYTLIAYSDHSFFDITLYVSDELAFYGSRVLDNAAGLAIEGAVGEEFMIERIGEVRAIKGIHNAPPKNGRITMLKKHLDALCSERSQ